jgi:hypothetical protein
MSRPAAQGKAEENDPKEDLTLRKINPGLPWPLQKA